MAENVELTAQEMAENELLNDAIAYAATMHRSGLRKGTTMPYIVHPLEVMHILEVMTGDKHLMAAGVLHDVVEDTSATLEDVYARFGDDIGALVEGHTEKHKEDSWEKRKEEALAHLAKADVREQKCLRISWPICRRLRVIMLNTARIYGGSASNVARIFRAGIIMQQ